MIPGEDTAVAHAQGIPLGTADATTPPVAAELHTCGACSREFRVEEMVHVECAFRRRCAWCALDAIEVGIAAIRAGQRKPTLEEVVRGR